MDTNEIMENMKSLKKKRCDICGEPTINKAIVYLQSNLGYFYCNKHLKIALDEHKGEPIKEWWKKRLKENVK